MFVRNLEAILTWVLLSEAVVTLGCVSVPWTRSRAAGSQKSWLLVLAPLAPALCGIGAVLLFLRDASALSNMVAPAVLGFGRIYALEMVRMLALASLLGVAAVLTSLWVRKEPHRHWALSGAAGAFVLHTVWTLFAVSYVQSVIGQAQGVLEWYTAMPFDRPGIYWGSDLLTWLRIPVVLLPGSNIGGLVLCGLCGGLQWAIIGGVIGAAATLGRGIWKRKPVTTDHGNNVAEPCEPSAVD